MTWEPHSLFLYRNVKVATQTEEEHDGTWPRMRALVMIDEWEMRRDNVLDTNQQPVKGPLPGIYKTWKSLNKVSI